MDEAAVDEVQIRKDAFCSVDFVALLQQPLVQVDGTAGLHHILQTLHARLEQLWQLHGRHVEHVSGLVDELGARLQADDSPPEPPQDPIVQVPSRVQLLTSF